MLKCCFNPRVLLGLGVTAVVLFVFVPGARGFLPVLATLACPLSMVAMMGGMAKFGSKATWDDASACAIESKGGVPSDGELQRLRSLVAELEQRPAIVDRSSNEVSRRYDVEA